MAADSSVCHWRSIDDLPLEGEKVLLYLPKAKINKIVVGYRQGKDSWWHSLVYMPIDDDIGPTHWMPLPAPPKG